MNKYWVIILLFSFALFSHCDEDCVCDTGPLFADLKIKLTINEENPELELIVFEGRVENGDTLFTDIISENTVTYEMEAGFYYSAAVAYKQGRNTILAINGKKMDFGSDDCDCDVAQDHSLNLRLKD